MNFQNGFLGKINDKIKKYKVLLIAYYFISLILILSLLLLYLFPKSITADNLTQIAIASLIFAVITSVASNKKDEIDAKKFTDLSLNLDQNTQKIIAQINHLEESQKVLADQIQSLQDRISAAEPTEPHDDEDIIDTVSDERD